MFFIFNFNSNFSFLSQMKPSKIEEDLFHHHRLHDDLDPLATQMIESQPSIPHHGEPPPFSSPEIVLFRSPSPSSPSHSSSDDSRTHSTRLSQLAPNPTSTSQNLHAPPLHISPEPHISSQFYTFNPESHSLMIRCVVERRLATPCEIRAATSRSVLDSWRTVWKDRNEDTAYLTAWKRIQDKLTATADENGNEFLCFKNNTQQFVSNISQWQDIVTSFHGDTDLKHLGLKETIERIKQVWTVGAKFYGIPESFIRVCVAACPVCNSASSASGSRSKRRRFEYTDTLEVPAKEVPHKLQQLAAKHKVVLCIRQKYIRYKPFMAEVKDYACHRAGEPATKKLKFLKREPYASKRCGCGFRIRAIVPITNYNEKDKTFVYQDEGVAVFKLYAVHSGHEPGPLDGNARIMHRVIGHKGGMLMDHDSVYGVNDEMENEGFRLMGKDEGDLQLSILQQVHEVRNELDLLEGKLAKVPHELLGSVSRDLFDVLNKLRSIREEKLEPIELLADKPHSDDVLDGDNDLAHWSHHHHERLYGDGKDGELIEDDIDSFGHSLRDVVPWEDHMRTDCRNPKELMSEPCKPERWFKCPDFNDKSILGCEDTKLIKPMRHDESMVENVGLVGIHVDGFYPENPKWFDSPCDLDSNVDCGDNGFKHGEIV